MHLCPDQAGQADTHRRTNQPVAYIEADRDQQRDHEQHCGRGRIGKRGRHFPVVTRLLGQRMPVPQHAGQPSGCAERSDRHHGHGDTGCVVACEAATDQERSQEAEQ